MTAQAEDARFIDTDTLLTIIGVAAAAVWDTLLNDFGIFQPPTGSIEFMNSHTVVVRLTPKYNLRVVL